MLIVCALFEIVTFINVYFRLYICNFIVGNCNTDSYCKCNTGSCSTDGTAEILERHQQKIAIRSMLTQQ